MDKELTKQNRRVAVFPVQEEEFAVYIHDIIEISDIASIYTVPLAPVFLNKIIHSRGRVVAIFDLSSYLFLKDVILDDESRIIVFDCGNCNVGIVAKKIITILPLEKKDIVPISQSNTPPLDNRYLFTQEISVSPYTDRTIYILDSKKTVHFLTNFDFSISNQEISEPALLNKTVNLS